MNIWKQLTPLNMLQKYARHDINTNFSHSEKVSKSWQADFDWQVNLIVIGLPDLHPSVLALHPLALCCNTFCWPANFLPPQHNSIVKLKGSIAEWT